MTKRAKKHIANRLGIATRARGGTVAALSCLLGIACADKNSDSMTDAVAPTKAETSSPGAANPSSTSPSPTNAAQNPDGVGGAGTLPTVNTEGGGPSGASSEPAPTTAPAETGCQGLDLEVGETSADGIQLLYAPEEFSAYLKGLGLTSEHLYFRSGSALMRLPLAGGGAEVVATLEIDPLLVHGERLYTSKSNDDGTVDLGVAALADPTMNVVIAPGVTVRDFDADDDAAYYSAAEAGIFRAPADGSGPVLVTQRFAEGMIVHEGYIYFIDTTTRRWNASPSRAASPSSSPARFSTVCSMQRVPRSCGATTAKKPSTRGTKARRPARSWRAWACSIVQTTSPFTALTCIGLAAGSAAMSCFRYRWQAAKNDESATATRASIGSLTLTLTCTWWAMRCGARPCPEVTAGLPKAETPLQALLAASRSTTE